MSIKKTLLLVLLSSSVLFSCQNKKEPVVKKAEPAVSENKEKPLALVIHGGAGTIKKENMTPEREAAYRAKLQEALDKGYAVLEQGGTAVEAVRSAINVMEDAPLFNAGRGAVFNSLGKQEMDASIMEGNTLNAGAVAGVTNIKNPINAAILVKDSTRHVMLSGDGAVEFAKQHGLTFEKDAYFFTEKRYKQLERAREKEKVTLDHSYLIDEELMNDKSLIDDHKFGTVGCVAIDGDGNIVAGTSTGGMTNKKYGRIGDSPIIGAGNYANNATCGISCTGTGEYFMRTLAAHETSNLMLYKEMGLKQAMKQVIKQIGELGGTGGMIGLDKDGNVAWDFNTAGMYRGYKNSSGENVVEIYEQ